MKNILVLLALVAISLQSEAQKRNSDVYEFPEFSVYQKRTNIDFPNINGYQTLKAEMHIHTMFSDGDVWPTVRIDEAWREGLDVIAITDHIEYTPHQKWVDNTPGVSYEVAKPRADQLGILLIPGVELTREKPDGHHNIFFVSDATKFKTPKVDDAMKEARKQGAFVMWNHPGWPDDVSTFFDQSRKWIDAGLIHGVEVYNEYEYYPKAVKWCRDHNLATLGCTDMHQVSKYPFQNGQNDVIIRPMTLIFAKDRSLESVKEAMFARRTVACFNHHLAGPADLLNDFFKASLEVRYVPSASGDKEDAYHIENTTDMNYEVLIDGRTLWLPAKSTVGYNVAKGTKKLSCEVKNLIIGEYEYLKTELDLTK